MITQFSKQQTQHAFICVVLRKSNLNYNFCNQKLPHAPTVSSPFLFCNKTFIELVLSQNLQRQHHHQLNLVLIYSFFDHHGKQVLFCMTTHIAQRNHIVKPKHQEIGIKGLRSSLYWCFVVCGSYLPCPYT